MSVSIILSQDLGDCNGNFNNGQMCSVYTVKFKFTNAK